MQPSRATAPTIPPTIGREAILRAARRRDLPACSGRLQPSARRKLSRSASNPGPGRLPSQLSARLRAGGGHVEPGEHRHPAEIGLRLFRCDGLDRQLQAPAQRLRRYRASARLLPRPRDSWRSARPFRSPACRGGRRRDDARPASDCARRRYRRRRLFPGTSAITGVMRPCSGRVVDLREPHHRDIDALRGDGARPPPPRPRGDARRIRRSGCLPWPAGRARCLRSRCPRSRSSGRSEPARRRAERLDHPAIVLAIRDEFREVVVEGEVDDAVRRGRLPPLRLSRSSSEPR